MALQNNIFQNRVQPVKPAILEEERVFVYVPKASANTPGIASFKNDDFTTSSNGEVELKWSEQLQVENNSINNPLETMARVKLSNEEFVNTNETTTIVHPTTGKTYSNTKSAVKFNRTNQDLFTKPGFMMVDRDEFEMEGVESADGNYNKYKLKPNDPTVRATIVKLNSEDFLYNSSTGQTVINWPKAHDSSGSANTNGYGLVKVNSNGYLSFENGLLDLNYAKLKTNTAVKPNYGANAESGFNDYADFVDQEGYAKRDTTGHTLLKLTKDAIGLSKVANKSFEEYVYNDFGPEMKNYFVDEFNKKLDKTTWNTLFGDWNEPAGDTIQKVVNDLREEDASIYDAIRTSKWFLGFFEDLQDLQNAYPATDFTFGSTAYIVATKTYWRVRTNNVNIVITGRVPNANDVPDIAKESTSWYRVGRRDTNQVYQWNGTEFELTQDTLIWIDVVLINEEDIQPYIESHLASYFFDGFRIGCRETGTVIKYNGTEWVPDGNMFYQWADSYIESLDWSSFVETDPLALRPNGIPSVGSSGKWVNSDHVHPVDETRLAKSVFDGTIVEIQSQFTNGAQTDFNMSLENGGVKILNIPYVRLAKGIHNWNGQTTFSDTEDSEDFYWSGTKEQFETQQNNIQNKSIIFVDDDENFIHEDFVNTEELDNTGVTISQNSYERFVLVKSNEANNLKDQPITFGIEEAYTGNNRYIVKSALPTGLLDNQLLTTQGSKLKAITNSTLTKIVMLDSNAQVTLRADEDYVLKSGPLTANQLVVGTGLTNRTLTTLTIAQDDGGIIVADGYGAIKSTSFGEAGKLLQTAGANGNLVDAQINVNTLVRSAANEFNQDGMAVSNGAGQVRLLDLGTDSDKLVVTDGAGKIKVPTIDNESLLFINNLGKVSAYPSTTADAGKVMTVQNNGKIGLQSLPIQPSYLPVTTNTNGTISGTILSFGQPQTYEQGVLYLW